MKKRIGVILLMIFFGLFGCSGEKNVEITFETNGGTSIETMTSLETLLQGEHETTKAGYTFAGWYEDASLSIPFDPQAERESWEITIYARWTANAKDYTIEHYQVALNGSYTLQETETLTGVTAEIVTATAKNFTGFSLNSNHEDAVPTLMLPASGDAVLKLFYSRNSYQITFDEAGGTAVADQNVFFGQAVVMLPTPTRVGYAFSGWIDAPTTMPAENLTLVASWQALPTYTITFDTDGYGTTPSQTIYQGSLASEPLPPSRLGYAFSGWFEAEANTAFDFSTPIAANLALKARYTPQNVNYHIQQYIETLGGSYQLQGTLIAQGLTDSLVTPTPEVPQGFSENTTHPDRVISGIVAADESLTLAFYYSRNTYQVTFESNASLSIQSISAKFEAPITKPVDPIRTGYLFQGWFSDSELENPYTFQSMPAGGIILYAKWAGEPTNLYFDSQGGSAVETITAPLDDPITAPDDPTKPGYIFSGWYIESSVTTPFATWVMPSGGITLYAKWTPQNFTIAFDENGGSLVADIIAPYASVISAPLQPTKPEYLFAGWFEDIDLQISYSFTTMPLNGMTLYAKWVSEAEGLRLDNVISLDPYTQVSVTGEVLMTANLPYHGFYLSDGSTNVLVLYEGDDLTSGQVVAFDAILITQEGLPRLSHVANLETTDKDVTIAPPRITTLTELSGLTPADYSPQLVELSGILTKTDGRYILTDQNGIDQVVLSQQFNATVMEASLADQVTLKGLLHRYQESWMLAVYQIDVQAMTDVAKKDLVLAYLNQLIPDTLQGWDAFALVQRTDPFQFGYYDLALDSSSQAFYDADHERFLSVAEEQLITLSVTIMIGETEYLDTITITLIPRSIDSVSDVLAGDEGDVFMLEGLIVLSQSDYLIAVIQDATGILPIQGTLPINYGDMVRMTVSKTSQGDFVFGIATPGDYLEVLSVDNEIVLNPEVIDLSSGDFLDTMTDYQTRFIRLRGYLEEAGTYGDITYDFLIGEAGSLIPVNTISYTGYEQLFPYIGVEVELEGILIWYESDQPLMLFAGQRGEVRIPEYTDDEYVEQIFETLSRELEDVVFTPYLPAPFIPYHEFLGGHITWEFVTGGEYYDQLSQWFVYVSEPQPIEMAIKVAYGTAERTYTFQTTLESPKITTIAEFKQADFYEMLYVEGIVVYRDPELLYLVDETGVLLIYAWEANTVIGDHVSLYGEVRKHYGNNARAWMNYNGSESSIGVVPFVVGILERNQTPTIPATVMSVWEAASRDETDPITYTEYLEVTGYLIHVGWDFNLSVPGKSITFSTLDEYTMYQLASWNEQTVTIKLMSGVCRSGEWDYVYLGREGDIQPASLSLSEKQTLIGSWLDEIFKAPFSPNSTVMFPVGDPLFESTIVYEVAPAYQALIDFETGSIGAFVENTDISVSITATIGVEETTFTRTLKIVGPEEALPSTPIVDAKALVGQTITIQGRLLVPFVANSENYSDTYAMLVEDESGILLVTLPKDGSWFYSGTDAGKDVEATGVMTYENGRYVLEATTWKKGSEHVLSLTAAPMDMATLQSLDHSHDDHLGEFVAVTGVLRQAGWAEYYLELGDERVYLQSVSNGYYLLEDYDGYLVTIKGFILGRSTFTSQDQLTLIVGNDNYDGTNELVTIAEPSDQVIAEKILAEILENRENDQYYPLEYIPLQTIHNLFPSAEVSYTALDHPELLDLYSYEFQVRMAEVDTFATIEVEVLYGEGQARGSFTVFIEGMSFNNLADLFDNQVAFQEITLDATVIYSDWGYSYYMIDDQIYYIGVPLGMIYDPGDRVLLTGKKTVIGGVADYTYNLAIVNTGINNEFNLTARPTTIAEIVSNDPSVLDLRREFLEVSGNLGYDPILNYFYLEEGGERIYIRHHLEEYGPFLLEVEKQLVYIYSLYTLQQYVGENVTLDLLFPGITVLGEYFLFDFIPNWSELGLPVLTSLEKLAVTKAKILSQYDGGEFTSGDFLNWMYYDPIHLVDVEYAPVDPLNNPIYFEDQNGIFANIVDQVTEVVIEATLSITDPITEAVLTDTVTFTVTVNPRAVVTLHDVIYGSLSQKYLTKGIVRLIDPETFIILEDETG
ncbi:MAG: InlB B-repeat-containing protein, partial [Candidatus Izemoplasmatales bacterium]|nr:InlB B-repeat-containing protein [Candidatus Izemoplasmatales bacterium]